MKLRERKEITRGILTLVMLIGSFQLIHLYFQLDETFPNELKLQAKESTAGNRKPMARRITSQRQQFVHSLNPGITSEVETRNETKQIVTMAKSAELSFVNERFPPLRYSTHLFIPPVHDPLMYGYRRKSKGFLTIGIPSIRRPNAEYIYLYQTLQSLINNTSVDDKREITVVVLLSDRNDTYNNEIARDVYAKFKVFCDDGFIRVIKAPVLMYPNFNKLKRTLYDRIERVKWRAKQNIDFAYLCLYSQNISDYYIQLEDDVLSAENFSTYIRKQIDNVTKSWFLLEFSRLGFIGKLFKDENLGAVADFMLFHFDKSPGDLLLGKMVFKSGQKSPIHTEYSLFQHNGKFSSLQNKMMPSVDSKFKDADKIDLPMMSLPKGKHPAARLVTSFQAVPGYFPAFAYDDNSSSFFWAKAPRRFDHFSIHFETPENFKRIIISTGDPKRKQDSLLHSVLHVALKRNPNTRQGMCGSYFRMADLVDGEIDTKAMGINLPNDIVCLKILVKRTSKTWVIIRDIVLI